MVAEMRNIKCKILDIKIDTIYKNEKSNLVINKILFNFILKHFSILIKRIFNEYLKTKNYYMIFLIFGIFAILIFSIALIKKIIILTILIFLFLLKDKIFILLRNKVGNFFNIKFLLYYKFNFM